MSSTDELEAALRDIGAQRYHRLHPFHHLPPRRQMHERSGPSVGAEPLLLSGDDRDQGRVPDRALRRSGANGARLIQHDGECEGEGGIARWLMLTDGLGLDRDYVTSLRGLLPATRFAVDAYVRFVCEKTLLEAIASSLTELFSPAIISERMSDMPAPLGLLAELTHRCPLGCPLLLLRKRHHGRIVI